MGFISSIGAVFRAIQARLTERTETAAHVGGTASYPRVQIHSVVENEPLDKDNSVRRIELIVESISDSAYGDAVNMNEENMELLFRDDPRLDNDHLRIVGITPGQLTEINETTDSSNELFRQLQRVVVFVESI